jgi:uncharacterized protein (TIGR04255 family)
VPTVSFAKAPLVELIAEFRWIPKDAVGTITAQEPQAVQQPTFFIGPPRFEEFYMCLGAELYKVGFNRSERLIQPNFPVPLHQAVYRFRSDASAKTASVLFQVGPGIFSVHGVPPYRSWETFLPFVRMGIEALLKCRDQVLNKEPLTQVILRYIDFFGDDLTQGKGVTSFMTEVLGISTTLPRAVMDVSTAKEPSSLFSKFVIPVKTGTLAVAAGDGKFNNQYGIVLDTTVTAEQGLPSDSDGLLGMLDSAHEIIRSTFLGMTRPIEILMQPQGDSN